jgi:hypothetical protein
MGGVTVTDAQILTALNLTLSAWGDRAKSAYCYDLTWDSCACEITLPCCGIDDVDIYLQDCRGCEVRLNDYEVRKGKVHLRAAYGHHGVSPAQLVAWAAPPQQPLTSITLAKSYTANATEMVLSGDLGLIPHAGWVNLCGAWYQYRCWERMRVTPERIDISDAAGGTETRNIDPTVARFVDLCGTVTVLQMVQSHCQNKANDTHDIGVPVELGISTTSRSAQDFIVAKTLSELFIMLAMGCTSDEKSSFFFEMSKRQDERAKEAAKRNHLGRKPRVRSMAFDRYDRHRGRHPFRDDYYNGWWL